MLRSWLIVSLLLLCRTALGQPLVATTDPLTPAEQQKKFKLPAGFEIQLVASEPDVNKPMNMKFDAHGRLWITHSLEYPFAAQDAAKARDALTIFSNLAPDGRAGRADRFAEHLNIPIGVLPLKDGEALAWSIPNIWRLIDSDGDGVADRREVLFSGFGFTDTHGDQNALTRWVDGWVYANHGFNNQSHVKSGSNGDVLLEMQSGNTYRFLADGSAIEQYSWGQVNPFGLCFDPLGNLYSADCHSRAVTMLLREGYYQSFGKPHDGLGFAPETTDLDHGGTGIAGVVYSAADNFPPAFRDVLFVGNVITNRVHCDRLAWSGSSPRVSKIEDFVVCDDPWFRPVDLQLGPDGALYIADFYNRIIGHYEVPLTHPGRDRERGRIWRVVYKGTPEVPPVRAVEAMPDLARLSAAELVALLGRDNLTVRMLATNALVDRFGNDALGPASAVLAAGGQPASPDNSAALTAGVQRAHALWVAARLGRLDEPLARRLADDLQAIVRVHLMPALAANATWQPWHFELVRARLADSDPFVRRAAASALAQHPAAENLAPLLKLNREAPAADAQLKHAARIALRDQLRSPALAAGLPKLELEPAERQEMLSLAASVPTGPAALLIFDEALRGNVGPELLARALPVAARYVDPERIDPLVDLITKQHAASSEKQLQLLRGMHDGLARRGLKPTARMVERLTELVAESLDGDKHAAWTNRPLIDNSPTSSPWAPEVRKYADGATELPMISSFPAGEQRTGVLVSPQFTLPAKLSFWMCGHDGLPGRQAAGKNFIRLMLSDGREIARSKPPRNDLAQQFTWDLEAYAGQSGNVEVIDGLDGSGYAWLAVSRFEPPVVEVPHKAVGDPEGEQAEAIRVAGELALPALADRIAKLAAAADTSSRLRLAAGETLLTLRPEAAVTPLHTILAGADGATVDRAKAAELLGRLDRDDARAALLSELRGAAEPVALAIAASLAGRKPSATSLLSEIRAGRAAPALLREPTVLDQLRRAGLENLDAQVAELTSKLSPSDDRIGELIKKRRAGFLAGKFDPEAGKAVFARTVCKACHRAGDVGGAIGPALDGIGNRGLDRLLEDTLDPNRNVDLAFRQNIIQTESGRTIVGFGLREEGQTLVLYDSKGDKQEIQLDDIAERSTSSLSPMPANISEVMSEQEYYELLAFLLTQRAK